MLHNSHDIHRQKPLHKVFLGFKGTGTNPQEINSKLRDTGNDYLGVLSGLPEALRTQTSLSSCLRKKTDKKYNPREKKKSNFFFFFF